MGDAKLAQRQWGEARVCELCGAAFVKAPWEIARGAGRYCSQTCSRSATTDLEIRFWAKVDQDRPTLRPDLSPCWIWTGASDPNGYGNIMVARRPRHITRIASRVAWELATGDELRRDQCILHICDNPSCVRNDEVGTYEVSGDLLPRRGHLALGTLTHNSRDSMAKGRADRTTRFTRRKRRLGERFTVRGLPWATVNSACSVRLGVPDWLHA